MSDLSRAIARAGELIERLAEQRLLDGRRWAIHAEPQSPWLLVDAAAAELYDADRVIRLRFAIWRSTGDLYVVAPDGAVGEDPISLEDLRA